MKTKERISEKADYIIMFLKQLKIDNLPLPDCAYDMKRKCDDIITLLKQGEKATIENIELKKYKKMWKELENKDLTHDNDNPVVNDEMYYIEQKYFPTEIEAGIEVQAHGFDELEEVDPMYKNMREKK